MSKKHKVMIHNQLFKEKRTLEVIRHSSGGSSHSVILNHNNNHMIELENKDDVITVSLGKGHKEKTCFIRWPKKSNWSISNLSFNKKSDVRIIRTDEGGTYLNLIDCPDTWNLEIRAKKHGDLMGVDDNLHVGDDEPGKPPIEQ